MDEAGIEARGTVPLRPYLDRIAGVHDKAGLIALFAAPGFASPTCNSYGQAGTLGFTTRFLSALGM